MSNFIYLDTETTGLDPDDEILEVSIIDDEDRVLLNTLIRPIHHTIWPRAQAFHGISPEMVKHFPTIKSYQYVIAELCHRRDLVIYNAEYDMQYLEFIYASVGNIHCAMEAYMLFINSNRWHKQESAARHCGYQLENAHRALADVRACRHIWRHIKTHGNK